ncbi:MAG: hypothetical protein ACLR6J_17805 [Parabacteroides merdae]
MPLHADRNSGLAALLCGKKTSVNSKIVGFFFAAGRRVLVPRGEAMGERNPLLEIAEQCSHGLFTHVAPDVEELLLGLIFNVEDEYARTVAYLVWAELFKEGKDLIAPGEDRICRRMCETLAQTDFGGVPSKKSRLR